MYPKEVKSVCSRDSHLPPFTAARLAAVRTWKQPSCVSADGWTKSGVHMYSGAIFRREKVWNPVFRDGVDGHAVITLSEINPAQEVQHCRISLTSWNFTKLISQQLRVEFGYQRLGEWGRADGEILIMILIDIQE